MRRPALDFVVARGHAACVCAFMLAAGCAVGSPGNDPLPISRPPHVTVRVVNECTDIVHVYFVADAGWRVRVATVGPLQSGLFTSRLVSDQPGRFVTMRIGSAEQPTPLIGHADPLLLGDRVVHLTVGASPEFDRWMLRR